MTIEPIDVTNSPVVSEAQGRLLRLLRFATLAVSIGYVGGFALLVCLRVRYPFELEWLEGLSVDHIRTILAGEPLYARPSLTFTPLTYTPGYFYLAALVSQIIGVGFLPLRLVSIAAAIGVLATTTLLVVRETGEPYAGVLAAGLFAAMFGWTDGWLDLARTDSLFLFLTILAVYILRWYTTPTATIAAATLMSLSFLVKQTGLIIAVPLAVWCAFRGWRTLVAFAAPVLLIVGGSTVLLNWWTDGWYLYYIFKVPRQHPVAVRSVLGFWWDLFRPLGVAAAVSVGYLAWKIRRGDREGALFYVLVAIGCLAGAWVSRLHSFSVMNVVLPAYLITAIVFAIAVHDIIHTATARSSGMTQRLLPTAAYGVCLVQLVVVVYSPWTFVPSAADTTAGRQLVAVIANTPGDVFVPFHGYLSALAGKDTRAHAAAIGDVIRGGTTAIEIGFRQDLREALESHRFAAVIAADPPRTMSRPLSLDRYYRPAERVVSRNSRFWFPEARFVPR